MSISCGRFRRLAAVCALLAWNAGGERATVFADSPQINDAYADAYRDADTYPSEYYDDVAVGCCDPVSECGDCSDCVVSACRPNYCDETCWFGADWLLWRLDGSQLPPLVTASPSSTPISEAGVLDGPATQILSGNEVVGGDWRSGFRVYGGLWLDPCHSWGLSGDYFYLGRDGYSFLSEQSSDSIVARPFFNAETGEQDAELVSVPDELSGTTYVNAFDEFQGAGLTLQTCLWRCGSACGCCPSSQLNLLAGYRYYQFDSLLAISENLTVLPGTTQPLVPGTQIHVLDQFTTRNDFHGGELGLQGRYKESWWWMDGMAKLAIGAQRRVVLVDGQTVNTVPGAGQASFVGGLLTSEVTNIGRYSDTRTVVIPEFRLGIGGQITQHISARAGYNVIIWGDVARAASHLPSELAVDPRNIPPVIAGGGPEPEFPGISGSQLVAHGFDFGLQFSY